MSAFRRKSMASGAGAADDEVSGGGGVVAADGVPAAYSRFSEDDGDWKQVPDAPDVAGLRRLPPLPLMPLVIGTSSGGRDCRKRLLATAAVCDTDPASWNTESGGGCDGTATPICR